MALPQHGSTASLETMGDGRLLSETSAGNTGVWEKGSEDPVALGPADHVSDLHVEFHQLGTDFTQALVRFPPRRKYRSVPESDDGSKYSVASGPHRQNCFQRCHWATGF